MTELLHTPVISVVCGGHKTRSGADSRKYFVRLGIPIKSNMFNIVARLVFVHTALFNDLSKTNRDVADTKQEVANR